MTAPWQELRPWKTDQKTAFEELCCQLAAHEPMPRGSRFVRKGIPDAGVECYWTLPDGTEHAWQAKFFSQRPSAKQWVDLDESVETALNKHPRLGVYTICLPLDRADPRQKKQEWFMDAWKQRVEKWELWARERRMAVEFRYWGDHEIWDRLSQEEHRGRLNFWFNREFFSDDWFRRRLDGAIANARERYTPKLNVELPIARLFDGLGRTEDFFNQFRRAYGRLKKAWRGVESLRQRESLELPKEDFDESMTRVLVSLQEIWSGSVVPLDLDG